MPNSRPNTKAETLLHPVRLRLLMTLAGREMTTTQLSELLPDIPKASLYRHVSALCRAGAMRVVKETPVRGTLEKVIAVCEEKATLSVQEWQDATPEDYLRYFTAYVASLLAQFRNYTEHRSGAKDYAEFAFNTMPLYLTDEEFGQMALELNTILKARLANTPEEGRKRRLLSLIVMPDANE